MSTYINMADAGDYNIPSLIGGKISESNKLTFPHYSF
jgi:hypothetical protein